MNSVVLYWCNVRTEGSLKNRQSQGLYESTTAQGTTNRFKANLLGNKLDLPSLGHHGPAKKEEKAVKAHELEVHMDELINVLGKISPFLEKLDGSTLAGAKEAAKSVVELQKKVSKLYDDMTELTADLRVGEISVDEPKHAATLKTLYSTSKRLLSTWTATEKKYRPLLRKPWKSEKED